MNEEEMQDVLGASRIGLWEIVYEKDQRPRFYGDAVMNDLLGADDEMSPEQRYLFHRQHIHMDDWEMFQTYKDRLTELRTEIIYRYIHPVTGEMYVRCGGKKDESKKDVIRIIGYHQDISDIMRLENDKQTEQRLAEMNFSLRKERKLRQDYYQELLDVQNCGLMAYTLPERRLVHMNTEALRMYAVKDIEEAQVKLGDLVRNLHYPDPETKDKLRELRKEENAHKTIEYEFVINQGTPKECHALGKSKIFVLPSGERAVVTTFLDVSRMVTLQNALKRAEEGSRAKSTFLFNMSHDLRTPMNAIVGYASLMEHHWEESEVAKDYLQKLKLASEFLFSIINNVLEMSRIESGKETLCESVCNVYDLNETIEVIVEELVREKSIKMENHISVEHQWILCDVLKLREILMNLIGNAIKYTPDGGRVRMQLREVPSDREDYAVFKIVVADNGRGIGKDYIPHLFEPFSRECSSSESGVVGTGLGLSIVKSLLDMMGGEIEVESELGKGTTITLTLAHKIVEEQGGLKKQVLEQIPDVSRLKGKRILLAEDNELNAEISTTMLEDLGLLIEQAKDGQIALDMITNAREGYYDVVLMDIQMPNMDGYEATRRIRNLSGGKAQIPIIAMTANAFEEDRQEAFFAGMNGHVAKPVNIRILMETLLKMIPV